MANQRDKMVPIKARILITKSFIYTIDPKACRLLKIPGVKDMLLD